MEHVTTTYAWQEAMELANELNRLCEEFSDGDRNVLVGHLRQSVVDIPATVAADIMLARPASIEPVIRLATELELVHKIYPAIETGSAPQKTEALLARMRSVNYTERVPEPVSEAEEGGTEVAASSTEQRPADQPAMNEPSSVPITPNVEG